MILRIALAGAVLAAAGLALYHPASHPTVVASSSPPEAPRHRTVDRTTPRQDLVVYVAGAVKRPGLYRLRNGDRYARAVTLAGGFTAAADAAGVNLAQLAADGEEIDVPLVGEAPRSRATSRRSRRRPTPAPESVDLNAADPAELARVPGIGRAIAARIVELREREGNFGSLDELLDVAGMTQSRLERARPYLRGP